MKALISPSETFILTWVTSWKQENNQWVPNTIDAIENCQRVVEVEPDNKVFPVHSTLFWADCPDNCVADRWYYKDGQVQIKPQDVPMPEGE
jgi:hypothetical protein